MSGIFDFFELHMVIVLRITVVNSNFFIVNNFIDVNLSNNEKNDL